MSCVVNSWLCESILRVVVVVQLLSCVQLFATPWTEALQAPLSFTISQSLLKLMSIGSVMSSNHRILCHPLFLLPSIFPSIRVFTSWATREAQEYGVGSLSFLQGVFPTQELNQGLLHCRCILYQLSYEGSSLWLAVMTNLDSVLKSRDIILPTKVHVVKIWFSSSHVWMWELDHKEGWAPKNGCFLNCDVGEDSWESLGVQGDQISQS